MPLNLFYESASASSVQGHPFPLHPRPQPRESHAATRFSSPFGKSLAVTRDLNLTRTVVSEPSEPPPIVAPPTKVASPPELSPNNEITLDALATTYVPGTPRLSRGEGTRFPPETDAGHDFKDLIAVLSELSVNGDSPPRFSTVLSLLKDRKPDAIETADTVRFKAYLQLAESAGIVTVKQRQDGYWWVTLRSQRNTNSDSPPQQTPPPHAGSRFRDLIQILNDLRLAGDSEPQFFAVGPRLLRNNPSIYEDAGVTRFEEYIKMAVEAGVVTVHGVKNGDGSLKLSPAYCSPPVCSSLPAKATDTPPTRATSTPSPFIPLVDFLKSRQLTSGQPTSFSEIFSHLVSTLGYPNLVSLCSSVPNVTTFGQYIDTAITSGLILLVQGTTASRDALLSLPSPPVQPSVSASPPSLPPHQKLTISWPSVSVNMTPDSFRDLTAVLTELRASTAGSVFRFSTVIPLLLERKPDAYASVGVVRFMDYVTLAVENGVVTAGEMDRGDGWVSLSISNLKPAGPTISLQPNKPSGGGVGTAPPPSVAQRGGGVDPKFVDLVETMGELWEEGDKTPLLAHVGSELMQVAGARARTLGASGAINFKAYAMLAKEAGIVEIHGVGGKQTMSLDPKIRVKAGYT